MSRFVFDVYCRSSPTFGAFPLPPPGDKRSDINTATNVFNSIHTHIYIYVHWVSVDIFDRPYIIVTRVLHDARAQGVPETSDALAGHVRLADKSFSSIGR